ncbi:MAG: DUF2474 domain-containing protein [Pseudomonadota bacterium]
MDKREPTLSAKLLWFVLLWIGGVGTVSIVAYSLRAIIL